MLPPKPTARVLLWAVLFLALLGTTACSEPLIIAYPPGAQPLAAQPSLAPDAASLQPTAPAAAVAVAPPAAATEAAPTATALPPTPTAAATAAPPTPTATATAASPSPTATAKLLAAVATATRQPATPTRAPAKALPTATPTRRAVQPTARPTATPTPAWPKELVITEAEIEAAAAGDAVPGLQVQGLDVQLANDTMVIAFASLRYGFVSLRNVTVQGHFEVVNGDVNFVADRIQPRNLATATIPGFVNQALDQSLADWYVESLSIKPGRLVAKVRPR